MQGWVYMCAVLLVAAGFAKVRDPAPTRGALNAASFPVPGGAVVVLGAVEITVGVAALAVGGSLVAWLVAALYAGFAGFVILALARSTPVQSCGCFGREDTPPSPLHVVVDGAAAVGAGIAASTGFPPMPDILVDQPLGGVPYIAFVAIGAFALYLLLAEVPRLGALAARTR